MPALPPTIALDVVMFHVGVVKKKDRRGVVIRLHLRKANAVSFFLAAPEAAKFVAGVEYKLRQLDKGAARSSMH